MFGAISRLSRQSLVFWCFSYPEEGEEEEEKEGEEEEEEEEEVEEEIKDIRTCLAVVSPSFCSGQTLI